MMKRKPIKPILRYHGGKWLAYTKIRDYLPEHRIYVEPFGGAASVLFRKDRSFSEVYNDLDGEVVNLFRVLQDRSSFDELHRKLRYTPYSRAEFERAYEVADDPIERARRVLIRGWMGHSSVGVHRKTGYRTNVIYVRRSTPANDWVRLVDYLDLVVERLRGVNIENVTYETVIRGHDSDGTLFYVDPPYVLETRVQRVYNYELENDDHVQLANVLHSVEGMVVLSGYRCDLYDDLYNDWTRVDFDHLADGAAKRVESLWINPAAQATLDRSNGKQFVQRELFKVTL